MSEILKRPIPLLITFVVGIIMVLEYFFTVPALTATYDTVNTWRVILFACVYVGTVNLIILHSRRVMRRTPGQWYYSAWLIVMIVTFAALGLVWGVESSNYQWMINNIDVPLGSTMYASLAFYMASGAYRVLKVRNLGTGLLLLSAFFVIIGNTPLFPATWSGFATIRNTIFDTFVVGSYRAIRFGVGLGGIALGIRTLFGLETGYLGRKE